MNEKNVQADPLAWEELHTEHIVQDEWIDFRKTAYRYPDGRVFEPFYSYSRKDYVVIVASDEDENYLIVRQFRQGIRLVTNEFPAGGIEIPREEQRHATVEEALAAAKRELKEETGYESDDWEFLLKAPSNATIADNYAYIFSAKKCKKVSGQALDETEDLHVSLKTRDEIEALIKAEDFQQAIHILSWMLAK